MFSSLMMNKKELPEITRLAVKHGIIYIKCLMIFFYHINNIKALKKRKKEKKRERKRKRKKTTKKVLTFTYNNTIGH